MGCACTSDSGYISLRIPDGSSIFTAEAKAIDLAFDLIESCRFRNKFIIFSDSLSVLKALNHTYSKNPQIQKLLEKHNEISKTKEIVFCWLPSHVGIIGNETADRRAKGSLKLDISVFKIPFDNFKPCINKYILSKWQTSWDAAVFNKLNAIKPIIKNNLSVFSKLAERRGCTCPHTYWPHQAYTFILTKS